MRVIDITQCLEPGLPVYPGVQPFSLAWARRVDRGEGANVSTLTMGTHAGTHFDAPFHFVVSGCTIDAVDPSRLVCRAQVVDVGTVPCISVACVDSAVMAGVDAVLFKTSVSRIPGGPGAFDPAYPYLEPKAAEWLVARGVRMVGIDSWGVDRFRDPRKPTHRVLLRAGVLILEGLVLRSVKPGLYTLVALPLKIRGAEASPVRAILIPGRNGEHLGG